MDSVLLPSGGTIHVDYESDDYAYVQDKRAASMCPILGFGLTPTATPSPYLYQVQQNNYVFIDISANPITSTDPTQQMKDLTNRYFQDPANLYMKLAVVMPNTPGLPGNELIPIYASIVNYGLVAGGKAAWVQVVPLADGSTPMVHMALQFIKTQLPGKAYPAYDESENRGARAIITSLASAISSINALMHGDDNELRSEGKCQQVDLTQSFARLTNPTFSKLGGGLRVKRVVINDNWNAMTQQYDATYGQEYKYTTTELIGNDSTTISSGVAAWEPSIGQDENPHNQILSYYDHNKGGPYNYGSVGLPIGEVYYPSPLVGYSRVEVLSIHRDTVKNMPTRQVTEFYTNKDFPYKSSYTTLIGDGDANVSFSPPAILQLLHINSQKAITQSQGFLVEMNDMSGKVHTQATYSATDSLHPISYTENFYNIKKIADNNYSFNHNFPTLDKPDGTITTNLIGRDIELMADFRQHTTETITSTLDLSGDFFFVGWFPVIIPAIIQPPVMSGTGYRSAALLKIVNHYGVLDSVETIDRGSMVSTKDMVYDAQTGNPLLTRTNNEHNTLIYNFTYPARWAYSGMGQAYQNIDATYSGVTFRNGEIANPTSTVPAIDMSIFESGDELYVSPDANNTVAACNGGAAISGTPTYRVWVVNTAKANGGSTPTIVFMDSAGNPYSGYNVTLQIIRSGHRNMLDQMVGSITSLNSPVNANNTLSFNDGTNVIQTSAATFKDHWRVDDALYLKDTFKIVPQYYAGSATRFYPKYCLSDARRHQAGSNHSWGNNFDPDVDYFSAQALDEGQGHTKVDDESWFIFDLGNSFNAPGVTINSAQLTLLAHTRTHTYPGTGISHGPNDAQLATAAHPNDFWIDRMTSQPPFNGGPPHITQTFDNAWGNIAFNAPNTGNAVYVKGTSVGNTAESYGGPGPHNSINILGLFKDMLANTNTAYEGLRISPTVNNPGQLTRVCFSKGSYIDVVSYNALNPLPPGHVGTTTDVAQGTVKYHFNVCRSIFSQPTINPYTTGILGDWRVDSTYAYYGNRKETDPGTPVDTRTGGAIANYQPFWKFNSTAYLLRNTSATAWTWNSTITQYNRKGYEIENKDPLGRFNSGLYGYAEQLPVAVANNAREQEVMFDGFEDYNYATQVCPSCVVPRHGNFLNPNIDGTQHHTGLYSLRVDPNKSITLESPVIDSVIKDNATYGLNMALNSPKSACASLGNTTITGYALTDSFLLLKGKRMLLSVWVNENNANCKCATYVNNNITVTFSGVPGSAAHPAAMYATGNIIEGWQRYEVIITVPSTATAMQLSLNNLTKGSSGLPVYFDDIRIEPFNANLKSFVYNASNLRLMAELDENNYATFYEYDDDGTLTRVKKETERGIQTITETRSAMQKLIVQ